MEELNLTFTDFEVQDKDSIKVSLFEKLKLI